MVAEETLSPRVLYSQGNVTTVLENEQITLKGWNHEARQRFCMKAQTKREDFRIALLSYPESV